MSKVYFKANARIKEVVGRELINDDNIAVAELVKNSIDAGARRVDIVFENADKERGVISANTGGRIIVADDGVGMDAKDIRDKWLNIAYSEKHVPVAGAKFLAGNKGIGRFSCDRLGRRLRLLSLKKGGKPLSLDIRWGDFEVDDMNKKIGDISLDLREEIPMSKFREGLPAIVSGRRPHGVVLEMMRREASGIGRKFWCCAASWRRWSTPTKLCSPIRDFKSMSMRRNWATT